LTRRQRLKYRLLCTPFLGPGYFLATYLFRLGFLDGRPGFWFAWHKLRYFFSVWRRIRALRRRAAEGARGPGGQAGVAHE
jgi:hypothetical protein